jgi:NAD+ kinase
MEISRIGIITHPEVEKNIVLDTVKKLRKKGVSLCFDPRTAEKMGVKATETKGMDVDLAIILGGDGTLLWSVNELRGSPLILGINTGRIGYLTELGVHNHIENIEKIFSGEFFIDERSKLRVNNKYDVLNELVIMPQRPASLLEFRISLNNEKITEFRADGVLVSTQTGSTGHALSLGGPIIHPEAGVYQIMPMVSFMQEQPPLIVPDTSRTEIEFLGKKKDAYMILDGNVIKKIKHTEKVAVQKSKNTVRFVRFSKKKWKPKITDSGYLN